MRFLDPNDIFSFQKKKFISVILKKIFHNQIKIFGSETQKMLQTPAYKVLSEDSMYTDSFWPMIIACLNIPWLIFFIPFSKRFTKPFLSLYAFYIGSTIAQSVVILISQGHPKPDWFQHIIYESENF
jgi:hypothetical protein